MPSSRPRKRLLLWAGRRRGEVAQVSQQRRTAAQGRFEIEMVKAGHDSQHSSVRRD